ncbi:MAG: hypothetical protein ABW049_03315 [Spongiibacteraceae bacterium]
MNRIADRPESASQFFDLGWHNDAARLTFDHVYRRPGSCLYYRLVTMQLSTQKPDVLIITVTLFGLGTLLTAAVQALVG